MTQMKLTTVILIAVLVSTVTRSYVFSQSSASENLSQPIECLVCDKLHNNSRNIVLYKGMDIPLCSDGCESHYLAYKERGKLDTLTAKIEPRSMLFQEDSNINRDLQKSFFWFGCYVLIGLIFGGAAAYLAVQKGQNAWFGFIMGLILNVIGLAVIVVSPKKNEMFRSEGLTKVPRTRDEVVCGTCGETLHPAAKKCSGCGKRIESKIVSEVELIGLSNGDK